MRPAIAVLLGLASALACSFPAYVALPEGNGGSSGSGGMPNDAGSGNVAEPACDDERRNGAETDVDCGGGDCSPCQLGQKCSKTSDCDDLACDQGTCQPAGCSDGIKNGDETDLDCGGSCVASPCDDELRCKIAADCKSGVCPKATLSCAAPTCDDSVLNGSEPTADCGASCEEKCVLLDSCHEAADCETETCVNGLCLPSAPTWQTLSPAGWVASASHTSMNSDPQDVIDGIDSTFWNTGAQQVPGMWFEIDMLEPQAFFAIEVVCTVERDDSAAALDVWLSNDGVFTEKAKSNLPGEDIFNIIFDEPQVARYIKLSLAHGTDRWWAIDEIRVKQ